MEVRSVQAATRIVSRSPLDSHASIESGYARLLREVSHGWALLQVSSRMAWRCEFLVLPFASPRNHFTLSLALSTSFLEREESPHMCTVRRLVVLYIGELVPILGDRTARHVAER